jgi:hypothetical protein
MMGWQCIGSWFVITPCTVQVLPEVVWSVLWLFADDNDADMPRKAAGSSSKSKTKKDASSSKAPLLGSRHKQLTPWQAFSKAARKQLLGWLHPVVKYNGKTLQPSNAVLARFMVSLSSAPPAVPFFSTVTLVAHDSCQRFMAQAVPCKQAGALIVLSCIHSLNVPCTDIRLQ